MTDAPCPFPDDAEPASERLEAMLRRQPLHALPRGLVARVVAGVAPPRRVPLPLRLARFAAVAAAFALVWLALPEVAPASPLPDPATSVHGVVTSLVSGRGVVPAPALAVGDLPSFTGPRVEALLAGVLGSLGVGAGLVLARRWRRVPLPGARP